MKKLGKLFHRHSEPAELVFKPRDVQIFTYKKRGKLCDDPHQFQGLCTMKVHFQSLDMGKLQQECVGMQWWVSNHGYLAR